MSPNFSSRGQVSSELLIGVLILFIFLLIVFMQNSFVSSSTEIAGDAYQKNGECLRLSFAISKVYTEGPGTSASFELNNSAEIVSLAKTVIIGGNMCGFLARVGSDVSLSPGIISLSNSDGLVTFAQVP